MIDHHDADIRGRERFHGIRSADLPAELDGALLTASALARMSRGMYLRAAVPEGEPLVLRPGDRFPVPTGLAFALPEGFEGQVRAQLGHELAVQRVVAMGAGADAALGLLDDVAQGPALQEAGVDAGDAVGDGVEEFLGVVAAERCGKEQLKHQNGVEGDAAGDVLRGRLAIGESPKQRRCAFAQSGQTRCRNC